MVEFVKAAQWLIDNLSLATERWREAQGAASTVDEQVKETWVLAWVAVREAMMSLRERTPSEAETVLSLTRCLRALGQASGIPNVSFDRGTIDRIVQGVLDALNRERNTLDGVAGRLTALRA